MIKEDQRISKPGVDRFTTLNHPVRLEAEIVRLVYPLYDLTPEEIGVVEGRP